MNGRRKTQENTLSYLGMKRKGGGDDRVSRVKTQEKGGVCVCGMYSWDVEER